MSVYISQAMATELLLSLQSPLCIATLVKLVIHARPLYIHRGSCIIFTVPLGKDITTIRRFPSRLYRYDSTWVCVSIYLTSDRSVQLKKKKKKRVDGPVS